MEKLIVSPGFVKKIEDEQDTQDQAITSNSTAIANLSETRIVSDVQIGSGESIIDLIASKIGSGGDLHGFLLFTCAGTLATDIPSTIDGISVGAYGQGWAEANGYYHSAYYRTTDGNVYTAHKVHSGTSWTWYNLNTTPMAITPTVPSGITLAYNGCYRVGNMIVISARLTNSNGFSVGTLLENFPMPKGSTVVSDGSAVVAVSNNRNKNITIIRNSGNKGYIYLAETISDTTLIINCTYIC